MSEKINENDEPPPLIDANDPIDDENFDDDDDDDEETIEFCEEPCKDLFSEKIFKSPLDCLNHCKSIHGFDIKVR